VDTLTTEMSMYCYEVTYPDWELWGDCATQAALEDSWAPP